jgi:hypothetical protein
MSRRGADFPMIGKLRAGKFQSLEKPVCIPFQEFASGLQKTNGLAG